MAGGCVGVGIGLGEGVAAGVGLLPGVGVETGPPAHRAVMRIAFDRADALKVKSVGRAGL